MNILHYYRKFDEKSRAFWAKFKRIDLFLFFAVIVVVVLLVATRLRSKIEEFRRIDIVISSQCINIFGGNIVHGLIQEFEEQHPDLRILIEDHDQTDIVFFDESEYSRLIADSALASLAPYNSDEALALPLVSFMDIFLYNIDILTAANLDRPPKTRVEFLATARAVMEKFPSYAFALGLSPADTLALRRDFYPWVWMNGGDISLIDTSGEVTLPREFSDIVIFFGQLNNEGLLAPESFAKTGAQRLEEFTQGKIAMMMASSRDIDFVRQNAHGITFGITAVPANTMGKNRLGLSGIYTGISGDCGQPDEAWRFLAFIMGKKHILAQKLGAVPGTVHANSDPTFPGEYITQDALYSKAWDIFEAGEVADYFLDLQTEMKMNDLIRLKLSEALKE